MKVFRPLGRLPQVFAASRMCPAPLIGGLRTNQRAMGVGRTVAIAVAGEERRGMKRLVIIASVSATSWVLVSLVVVAGAAATASPAQAAHCARVAWRSFRDGDQHCPRYHSLLSDRAFSGIRWSSWGGPVANGIGSFICTHADANYCGNTPYQTYATVAIRLSRPTTCGRIRIYTRIKVSTITVFTSGQALQASWGYRCRPVVPARGLGGGGG